MGKSTEILVSSVPLFVKKISYGYYLNIRYRRWELSTPMSTHLIKDVVHLGMSMIRLLRVSEMINLLSHRTYLVCLDDFKSFLTFTSFNECPCYISYFCVSPKKTFLVM